MSEPAHALLVDRLAWERKPGPPISFAVAPGGRVFACGDGAPALLLALAGFLPVPSGRIVCEGRDLTGVPAPHRHIAYIPAGDSLMPRASLIGNVMLTGADRATAAACLARVGLREVADQPAADVTAAQRRLTALARALGVEPSLLLVDEAPDDPAAIPDALTRLTRPAAVISTASAELALARADRIVLLRHGGVAQLATPRDLYARPADAFAATWSGPCNLVPVMLDGEGPVPGSVRARLGDHAVPARYRDGGAGPALLAVRPHHVRPMPGGIPARVQRLDYAGATTRVMLDAAGTVLRMDIEPDGLAPGDAVSVGWRWSDAWPLAAATAAPP
jgi:iron(III) transport system ATP-binding protein